MPQAMVNGIELEYDTFGSLEDPALLLIMGLGGQMIRWEVALCERFVKAGFFVIRFDNRDVGLSTKVDADVDVMTNLLSAMGGGQADAPYDLWDMGDDAVGILDALRIEKAHVVGVSMGGMIAQCLAIRHGDRVLSLTSIMSTTGDREVGQPDPSVMPLLVAPPAPDRESAIENSVVGSRAIGSPDYFDEAKVRAGAAESYDRSYYPKGVGHQLLAIATSGSRTDQLRQLHVPALVIHGDRDLLVNMSGGQRTAEAIPGARLLIIPGMGHDLPEAYWDQVIAEIADLAETTAPAPER